MSTRMRDRFWIWGQAANSHFRWLQRENRTTPVEGARYLGISNIMLVVMGNEPLPEDFPAWQADADSLQQVVWSIMGDASSHRNDTESDLDTVLALVPGHPNITGAIMDDLFLPPYNVTEEGRVARWSADQIAQARAALHAAARPLDLYAVFYGEWLDGDARYREAVGKHLAACDKVTFWTWEAQNLDTLEARFAQLEALTSPQIGKLMGVYLWDYGGANAPIPVELLERQCELGRAWLRQGRIEGMIFVASTLCDLDLDAVEWARTWIARVGDEVL